MELKKEDFIQKYIEYTNEMNKAMEKDNYNRNNKFANKLNKLNKEYKNEKFYIDTLKLLMNNENLEVASNAAADSLRNNSNKEKVIETLEKISKLENIGITSFSAKIALERWRTEGTLD